MKKEWEMVRESVVGVVVGVFDIGWGKLGRRFSGNSFVMSGMLTASTDFFFCIFYYDHNDSNIYI
jgi:hypothetical protein